MQASYPGSMAPFARRSWILAFAGMTAKNLVQPEFGDVAGILLELAALDLFDEVDEPLIGARREPDLLAFAHDKAVEEFDLGAAALCHVLAHRRALLGRAARLRADMLLVARQRVAVAFAGAGDDVRRQMADLFELVAERLADADRLAAEACLETADPLVLRHRRARQPGASRDAVRHRVRDELRPALAPEVVGHLRAVGMRDEAVDLLRPFGDAAMHFAGAIDGVAAVDAADAAAMHMAGLDEADADIAGDAAQHLAPPDDLGDRRLVHAVLQRDDIAARREILPDQERRPLRVVGLRADERDIDRRLFREL